MNRYQKSLYAAAFLAVLAVGTAPAFAAGDPDPAPAASHAPEAASTYVLHAALFRAPASPAAAHRR